MNKIFQYECRRLMSSRFFAGLFLVVLVYGWQVLTEVTILGAAHTAPFSPWSFGDYISRMLPLLWAGTQLFLTAFLSPKARRTEALTDVLQDSCILYALVRQSAVLAGTAVLALAVFGEGLVFYGLYFHWYEWRTLLFPFFLVLMPGLVFGLGSGWFLGQLKSWLVYGWMFMPFLWRILPLPDAFGLLSGTFFSQYPLTLEKLDPEFTVPGVNLLVQAGLLAGGAVFSLQGKNRRRNQK